MKIDSELLKMLDLKFPPDSSDGLIKLSEQHATLFPKDKPITAETVRKLNPLVVARNSNNAFFLGEPQLEGLGQETLAKLVEHPSRARQTFAPVRSLHTIESEPDIPGAAYCAFIYRDFFTPDPQSGVPLEDPLVNSFADPEAIPESGKKPEIFTFSTIYKTVWRNTLTSEGDANLYQRTTPAKEQAETIWELLTTSAESLIEMADDKYLHQTGSRFQNLFDSGMLGVSHSTNPYQFFQDNDIGEQFRQILMPSQEGVGFIPNTKFSRRTSSDVPNEQTVGELVISDKWVESTVTHPVRALGYFTHAASLARDHFNKQLIGSEYYFVQEIGAGEILYEHLAQLRATNLMHRLFKEVEAYDGKIFSKPLRLDSFCSDQLRFPRGANHYDDSDKPSLFNIIVPQK